MPAGMQGCSGCRREHPQDWFWQPTSLSCGKRRKITHEERVAWQKKQKAKAVKKEKAGNGHSD
jgi:hypothetical protein